MKRGQRRALAGASATRRSNIFSDWNSPSTAGRRCRQHFPGIEPSVFISSDIFPFTISTELAPRLRTVGFQRQHRHRNLSNRRSSSPHSLPEYLCNSF